MLLKNKWVSFTPSRVCMAPTFPCQFSARVWKQFLFLECMLLVKLFRSQSAEQLGSHANISFTSLDVLCCDYIQTPCWFCFDLQKERKPVEGRDTWVFAVKPQWMRKADGKVRVKTGGWLCFQCSGLCAQDIVTPQKMEFLYPQVMDTLMGGWGGEPPRSCFGHTCLTNSRTVHVFFYHLQTHSSVTWRIY